MLLWVDLKHLPYRETMRVVGWGGPARIEAMVADIAPKVARPSGGAMVAKKLHDDIDAGFMLPTQWYGDKQIFHDEIDRIHRRSWHFATHTDDLKEPGDVYIRTIAGVPIVLVRDLDRTIRGFINICRHRGHPVVKEGGNRVKLRCDYHGWSYGLNGELAHAPRQETDETFDPKQFGLVPIQVQVWGPMIWVNIDLTAPPFFQWIEGMPEVMREHGMNVEDYVFGIQHEWEINCNWKIFQDNTIECYHCPTAHPELARVLEMDPEKHQLFVGGRYWIHHIVPFRPDFAGSLSTQKHDGKPFNYYYHWVFPTTYLQFAGKGFDIGSVDVVAVDKIRFRHLWFMPPSTPKDALAEAQKRLDGDPTIWQDVDLCNRVQLGHMTGLAPTGRVLTGTEHLLSYFQHLIVDMMGETSART
jgi:phenylpropionate dioxygenase-like ring-hydroxylating dioxygenase large terminal subunit